MRDERALRRYHPMNQWENLGTADYWREMREGGWSQNVDASPSPSPSSS